MMRAWGNRADTFVCDEPLYAHYLKETGLNHPGRDEVLAAHDSDWRRVVDVLLGPVPGDKPIFYQKHMAHHLLPDIERNWLAGLRHAFLIRDPREMLLSLEKHWPNPTLADTGLPQQVELLNWVRQRTGRTPPVMDARDVLQNPRALLTALCAALGVPFDEAMLRWPPGRRQTDGVWAQHWYAAVERSTGFEPYRPRAESLPAALEPLLAECQPYYDELYALRP